MHLMPTTYANLHRIQFLPSGILPTPDFHEQGETWR